MLSADTPCSIARHFKATLFVPLRNSLCKDSDYINWCCGPLNCLQEVAHDIISRGHRDFKSYKRICIVWRRLYVVINLKTINRGVTFIEFWLMWSYHEVEILFLSLRLQLPLACVLAWQRVATSLVVARPPYLCYLVILRVPLLIKRWSRWKRKEMWNAGKIQHSSQSYS